MITLLESIYNQLSPIATTKYELAPPDTNYPYVTYTLNNPVEQEESTRQDISLDLNIWDNLTDTTRLETLVSSIDTALDRLLINTTINYKIYRDTPYLIIINDPDYVQDENIRRRNMRYIIQYYE